MDIHVDALRIDRDIEEIGRLRIGRDEFLVGLQNGLAEIGRTEITAVHEHVLFLVGLLGGRRTPDEALDADHRRIDRHFQQVLGDVLSADGRYDALPQIGRRKRRDERIAVVERKGDGGIAQRHAQVFGPDVPRLDGRFLEETSPGRRVVEQVADHELRTLRRLHRLLRDETSSVDGHLRAQLVLRRPRAELHLGHRGDGRQGLPAETERTETVQIGRLADFGRCMPLEREPRIGLAHSAAVIDHLNRRPSALAVIHRDGRASGVHGIFHQLLDDRSGTPHHLACGDLVGDAVGQHSDPVVLHGVLSDRFRRGSPHRPTANGRNSACGRICSYRGSVRPSGNARSRRAVRAACARRHSPTRARGC